MSEPMNGADFVALRRLSNGDDETLADVGATCERVPASSLPWLIRAGRIQRVAREAEATESAAASPAARARRKAKE